MLRIKDSVDFEKVKEIVPDKKFYIRKDIIWYNIRLNPNKISRKGVNMRIITKKEEQEIESIKKQNEFLSKGYRALNIALDYQSAIVAILKTVDMKEIEIDDKLFLSKDEIRVGHTINHTTIIKLVEKE